MRHLSVTGLGVCTVIGGLVFGAASAVSPASFPPLGHYRVDSETTRTVPAGPYVMTVVQHTDSETGEVTVTRSSSLDPENASKESYQGEKPPLQCVAIAKAPPLPANYACPGLSVTATAGGTVTRGVCNGVTIEDTWSRVDDQTWEHRFEARQPAPGSLAATGGAQAQAMADLRAQMEAAVKGSDPEQAEAARQGLAAMGGGNEIVDRVSERWTRVADSCS